MSVVKEYFDEKTKIRIHNDYINTQDKVVKETIMALVISSLKDNINNNLDKNSCCNHLKDMLK